MQIILHPSRRSKHVVLVHEKTVNETTGEEVTIERALTFEPQTPVEVADADLPALRDDFIEETLLVCRQPIGGPTEFSHKLTRTLAVASDEEMIAIAEHERLKATLYEKATAPPAETVRRA